MKKKNWLLFVILLAVLFASHAVAQQVIPRDEFPSVNSAWNLNNTGIYFTDGEYFYVSAGGRLWRLDDQLQLDVDLFDRNVSGMTCITYMEEEQMLYFRAYRVGNNKEGGLYRVGFCDGTVTGKLELLAKGKIANYAIDDQYICYHVDGYNGIYRINHDGSDKRKLSGHEIQSANPAIRMHIEDGILYYINKKDHYLWSVPLDAPDAQQAKVYIDRPMHYYVKVPYLREGASAAEDIFIYVEYASNTDKLDRAHLAVVDCNGERVHELDFLRDIQTRYINYYQGVLYYIDSSVKPHMPRWISINDGGERSGSIAIEGQGDLKAFKASDGTHWMFNNRLGYLHVFDGWLAIAELGENFTYYNPKTGRSNIAGGAGSDVWFVNLETLVSYRCRLDD